MAVTFYLLRCSMLSRRATEFYVVAPSVWNVPHVTVVAPRILRWPQIFGGNLCNHDVKDENAAFGLCGTQ